MAVSRFADRADAGRRLGERLAYLRGEDIVVLGLARGGMPVAFEVARRLEAPLDVILVRRLHRPGDPGLTIGAVGEGGAEVLDEPALLTRGVTAAEVEAARAAGMAELGRLEDLVRQGRPPVPLDDRTVVLVDDGIVAGAAARAACRSARRRGSDRTLLAAPVATAAALVDLSRDAELVCLEVAPETGTLGEYYERFPATSDSEVIRLLRAAPVWLPG